ncbi:hypothetical protein COY25_02695 [Candidatus Uhrbacteria bacterium CG_4_10_14_0_2_um_filter_41_7]|uniref:Uncharacterized protein n=1 Tax=Candidatus Uhrbacteria bacterium CG_4_9_14_3_um_filter_41_35 TaxID=1975034 RepID=A0A2M7XFH8_9BACT|nr:MAG: hypothetical protein COV92_01735 [Candidatus Uhrbacteria bacterium CG11_big_fil_rev_8_21_14_0_20_41_9]PIZ54015.1 MAG: hypothetical protein COY25_02695 [Candidatus Uhrbacteria bacterium CG_4_10_14_0_2_um_filter_41_7]PJA46618.1 MAG: hypothetical protein CO173_02515 [Candidatus Uhrbacteria bacterium CG_4_9_14_3_um_filter_41_35]
MSEKLTRLTAQLARPVGFGESAGEEMIEVSAPASTAATIYEKLRTSIDYQEEHLLRRNAILRIIKRYIGSDVPIENMAGDLLRELIWARYLPNKEVPARLIDELIPIFMKYEPLLRATEDFGEKREDAFNWVIDVLSTEVEYAITPPVGDEALVSYMYEEMRSRIEWDPRIVLSSEDKDLLLYIAIHQILLRSNQATLRFRVLTLYYPDWPGASNREQIEDITKNLKSVIALIERQLSHPVTGKLSLLLRRKAGVFRVIRDTIEQEPKQFPALLDDPDLLDRAVARQLKKRTTVFRKRLQRTVLRAVLFLFLTKMLLALALEVPYDLVMYGEISATPLLVNILFHPLFLAVIGLTIGIKERKNTTDYQSAVRALSVSADHDLLNVKVKASSFGAWSKLFGFTYTLMYLFTYGLIGFVLVGFNFTWLSVALFLFFISLVTFFGIRIRMSTKEVVLSDARSGLIGTLFDFFMLPLVIAGRWLSHNVSKINIFIYFFDFIIEAPLKVAIRFVESWISFVREKKDEI